MTNTDIPTISGSQIPEVRLSKTGKHLAPHCFKKGMSGNPKGRPKKSVLEKRKAVLEKKKWDKRGKKQLPSLMQQAFFDVGGVKRLIEFAKKNDNNYKTFLNLYIKMHSVVLNTTDDKKAEKTHVNFFFGKDQAQVIKDASAKQTVKVIDTQLEDRVAIDAPQPTGVAFNES